MQALNSIFELKKCIIVHLHINISFVRNNLFIFKLHEIIGEFFEKGFASKLYFQFDLSLTNVNFSFDKTMQFISGLIVEP